MREIVDTVLEAIYRAGLVQVEVSARHVHLSQADVEKLFEHGELTPRRELSQPGQFLAEERVTIIGPKGIKKNVAVLGPVRKETQVELSKTDCAELGVKAHVRESGDVEGSGSIILEGAKESIEIAQGCIVAKNHIHMTPESAARLGLSDKQAVSVRLLTDRQVIFPEVLIRVSGSFRDRMHIDFDEANAGGVEGFTLGQIVFDKPEDVSEGA